MTGNKPADTATDPSVPTSVMRTVRGRKVKRRSRFYRVRYVGRTGKRHEYTLKLQNGERVTDKSVATTIFDEILKSDEREGVGLIDPFIESASLPMCVVVARYIRHLRGKRSSRSDVRRG